MTIESEEIKADNYTTHAIGDIERLSKICSRNFPRSADRLRQLSSVLKDAQKFLLPNRCELLDPDSIGQAHLDLLRLPYPCVALEVPWDGEVNGDFGGMAQLPATQRIALCWEAGPDVPPPFGPRSGLPGTSGEVGVCILPINRFAGRGKWKVFCFGAFLPRGGHLIPRADADLSGLALRMDEARREAGLGNTKHFWQPELFKFLPEIYDGHVSQLGVEKAQFAFSADIEDYVSTAVQTCAVLNCSNVVTTDLPPPAELNRRRLAKAEVPFFSYKVLTLSTRKNARSNEGAGGTHTSPRSHLRRGHMRQLPGRSVYVRHTMVGGHGLVQKDYKVIAPALPPDDLNPPHQ